MWEYRELKGWRNSGKKEGIEKWKERRDYYILEEGMNNNWAESKRQMWKEENRVYGNEGDGTWQ